jgi:glyoxylase-like metal-dependent hydrolase (beta-lactamase superfamily II)
LAPDLFYYIDSCNVFLLRFGDRAVVVDAGAGGWVDHVDELGVRHVDAVVLTHAHRDQCCGLYRRQSPLLSGARIVAPAGDAQQLETSAVERTWREYGSGGCPASYAPPRIGIDVDASIGADSELRLGPVRLCAVATPGHTRHALSYIVAWHGRQLAFCGDAVCAGGHVHAPFHLEWDHWTPEGALAAWYGLERLAANRIDLLLPAHGEPVLQRTRQTVRTAQRRLLRWVRAKTAIAPGEASRWLDTESLDGRIQRISPHLFAVGGNGFLLTSGSGAGLVVDPTMGGLPPLEALVAEAGITPEVAVATHFHHDHSDGLAEVRRRWGARVWLHPWVAEPLRDRDRLDVPYLPPDSVSADRTLPEEGVFLWREYRFRIRPFPGQTWWHCAFDAEVDGRQVLFSGDNFQPPTRWNGTGGFCAYNGSRFVEGFSRSAQAALDIAPDIVCNGHRCLYEFDAGHYRKILDWSQAAERTLRELCPSGRDWLADYDLRACRWEPFVVRGTPGSTLEISVVYTNHRSRSRRIAVLPQVPDGFGCAPARRRLTVPANTCRRARFTLQLPSASAGRCVMAADIWDDGNLQAEACVAVVDVS